MKGHMLCAWVLLGLLSISSAYGYSEFTMDGVVICKYSPVPGGYRYYVTVQNNELPSTDLHVDMLHFQLWPATDVVSPSGWSSEVTFAYVYWSIQPNSPDWTLGIAPGQSLAGFEFTSTKLPASIQYVGIGRSQTLLHLNFYGYAVPQLVPEPSALLALAGGLGALGLPMLRGRKWAASFRHRDPLV